MPTPSSLAPAPGRRSLYDLTFPALERELEAGGVSPVHAKEIWRALFREPVPDLRDYEAFPAPLKRWVEAMLDSGSFFLSRPPLSAEIESSDGLTRKFLLRLEDGQTIETVQMGFPGRFTACVSTQAGCAMGCVFCATGQMGFVRHLTPAEIVTQVLHVQESLRRQGEAGLRNLVLMGMGEPLHNYESVMTALEIISDTRGLGIAPSRITISTVGVVPGILRLAEEAKPYNLAVSLHDATQAGRAALVPASNRWPLEELLEACRLYGEKTARRIFFEWTLIAGSNDSAEKATQLAEALAGINAHVNLIPLNPTQGFDGTATALTSAKEFQKILRTAGIPSTVRQRRGIDVAAGCGQLRAEKRSRERLEAAAAPASPAEG